MIGCEGYAFNANFPNTRKMWRFICDEVKNDLISNTSCVGVSKFYVEMARFRSAIANGFLY